MALSGILMPVKCGLAFKAALMSPREGIYFIDAGGSCNLGSWLACAVNVNFCFQCQAFVFSYIDFYFVLFLWFRHFSYETALRNPRRISFTVGQYGSCSKQMASCKYMYFLAIYWTLWRRKGFLIMRFFIFLACDFG